LEKLILIENRSSDELCLSEFAQSQIKLELIQNNNNNNQDQDQDDDIMNKSLSIVRKQKLQEFPSLYLDEDPTLIGTEEHASTRQQLASASDSSTTNNITSHSMNSLKRFVIYDEQDPDEQQQQQLDKDDREKSVEDLTGLRVATATSTERKNKVASRSTNELQEKKSNSEMSSNYYSYNNNKCPLMSVSSHSFNKNLSLGM